jgi:hypothetical protein
MAFIQKATNMTFIKKATDMTFVQKATDMTFVQKATISLMSYTCCENKRMTRKVRQR